MVWNEVSGKRRKLQVFWIAFLGSCVLILSAVCAQAQTFAEWFSQKKTQTKYLTQQIAALNQYGSSVRQGYRVMQGGWSGIGDWVSGELNLHSAYYSSLWKVNPMIRDNPKADSIIRYVAAIPLAFDRVAGMSVLGVKVQAYIAKVKAAVLGETDKDVAGLELVITDGKVEMSDDERMKRLDEVYDRVKDRFVFSAAFCNAIRILVVQRRSSLNEINTLKSIYGMDE